MKSKTLKTAVVAILLVFAICSSLVVFAACNDGDENSGTEMTSEELLRFTGRKSSIWGILLPWHIKELLQMTKAV